MSAEQWITWALQGLIGFILVRLWKQLDAGVTATSSLTVAVAELKLDLHKFFVMKTEWTEVRERLRTIEDYVAGQKAIEAIKEKMGKS